MSLLHYSTWWVRTWRVVLGPEHLEIFIVLVDSRVDIVSARRRVDVVSAGRRVDVVSTGRGTPHMPHSLVPPGIITI